MAHSRIERLHAHSQKFLKSDVAFFLAILFSAAWVIGDIAQRKAIEVPSVATLFSFLMIFMIERSHAKETKAIHLKLDELIAAQSGASNRLIRAEEAPESALAQAHEALQNLASTKEPHEVVSIEHTNFFDDSDLVA